MAKAPKKINLQGFLSERSKRATRKPPKARKRRETQLDRIEKKIDAMRSLEGIYGIRNLVQEAIIAYRQAVTAGGALEVITLREHAELLRNDHLIQKRRANDLEKQVAGLHATIAALSKASDDDTDEEA